MVVLGGCGKFSGRNPEIGMCLLIENSESHKFLESHLCRVQVLL